MGLHAGEYKVNGADMVGLAFHVGARVAAKARAGEVLVSSAVKDLMPQSEIRFKDCGVPQRRAQAVALVPGRTVKGFLQNLDTRLFCRAALCRNGQRPRPSARAILL
jgi:class 3 adenylate cyclase